MYYQYRFTLNGVKPISEPGGWKDIVINLDRDKEYWTLVEGFDAPFEFYGTDGIRDGGYNYVKSLRDGGPDYELTILIEISLDSGDTFETIFEGTITDLKEFEEEKIFQFSMLPKGLWSTLINRKGTAIDVKSALTLEGTATSPANDHTLGLTSQEIFQQYSGTHTELVDYNIPVNAFGQIDFDNEIISEIEEKFLLPRVENDAQPTPLFVLAYDGDYDFDIRVVVSDTTTENNHVANLNAIFRINNDSAIFLTSADLGINGVNGRTQFTYSGSMSLKKGDEIRLYFDVTTGGGTIFRWTTLYELSFLIIEANTVFEETSTVAFRPHDLFRTVIRKITDVFDPFYSEYLGDTESYAVDYDAAGCGSNFDIMLGQHIRGYSITDKPFSVSLDDLWEGFNKIFNLGLGLERVSFTNAGNPIDQEVIRIEPKSYWFDDSSSSAQLSGVNKIEISYDESVLYKSISTGFQKWKDESYLGVDDPQTQHSYSTRFKITGSELKLLSPFVAASLVIERGRRKSRTENEDWNFDDEVFIIHTEDHEEPKLFSLGGNLLEIINGDTRYNVRLTPKSSLIRWNDFISIGIAPYYPSDEIKFNGGEGNTKMMFRTLATTGCESELGRFVGEDADLRVDPDYLFSPLLYKFTHHLNYEEYKSIREARKKSIVVNYVNNAGEERNAICFIKKLAYKINEDQADFECWVKREVSATNFLGSSETIGDWRVFGAAIDPSNPLITLMAPIDSGEVAVTLPSSLEVQVNKFTNLGEAEGNGDIKFYRNGVLEHTESFVIGANVSSRTYTYTGLSATDVLLIVITEI